jgi:hypothetical protein
MISQGTRAIDCTTTSMCKHCSGKRTKKNTTGRHWASNREFLTWECINKHKMTQQTRGAAAAARRWEPRSHRPLVVPRVNITRCRRVVVLGISRGVGSGQLFTRRGRYLLLLSRKNYYYSYLVTSSSQPGDHAIATSICRPSSNSQNKRRICHWDSQ